MSGFGLCVSTSLVAGYDTLMPLGLYGCQGEDCKVESSWRCHSLRDEVTRRPCHGRDEALASERRTGEKDLKEVTRETMSI